MDTQEYATGTAGGFITSKTNKLTETSRDIGQIEINVVELDRTITEISQRIEALGSRIAPVLRPLAVDVNPETPTEPRERMSTLADQLTNLNDRLRYNLSLLYELNDRIEL